MIYKKLSLLILFFATGLLTASAQKSPQDMDRFIDALMKKMTTEEKIGQSRGTDNNSKNDLLPCQ